MMMMIIISYGSHRILHLPRGVLGLSLQVDGGGVLHDPLDGHLDELVEGVQLLSHQTLLVKVRARSRGPRLFLFCY